MYNKNVTDTNWYKLDNAAIMFPATVNKKQSNVYRVAVTLKEKINSYILEQALDQTLYYFDNFRVKLKRGLFWYYYEANNKKPIIEQEQDYPCVFIDSQSNNQFLFKVTYFQKRINLEVFHSITDGLGAMTFLKALTINYLKISNKDELSKKALAIPSVEVIANIEDSYNKNYQKDLLDNIKYPKAYQIKDKKNTLMIINVITGYIDTSALIKLCRAKQVTVTHYLTALYMWCIYKEYLNKQPSKYPINIGIPVNLRQYFGSTTLTNFFTRVTIGFKPTNNQHTFDEILETISKQFKEEITKEKLSKKISYNVSAQKNILIRFTPLFIKKMALKKFFKTSLRSITTSLSNLGKIAIPNEFEKYVDNFHALAGLGQLEAIKCVICTYGNKLACTFTSNIENHYIEREFFRHLAFNNIDIVIESNGESNEKM